MKLVSIDLETTGLDPEACDIVEFGAVIFDTDSTAAVEEMPTFHGYLTKEKYQGEPYALGMHGTIFERIARRVPGFDYFTASQLGVKFKNWLATEGFTPGKDGRIAVTCTGKNYAKFDDRFLGKIDGWGQAIAVSHRVIDVGTLYYDPRVDQKIPDTQECLRRAGLSTTLTHTAVEDARNVVRLLRFVWNRSQNP